MQTGIVYVSQAAYPFEDSQLQEIADQSVEKNRRLDVTGYLYYANQQFLQYIEGPREGTMALMDDIRADERHTVVEELADHAVPHRRFQGWEMRWIRQEDLQWLHIEHAVGDIVRGRTMLPEHGQWVRSVWNMIDDLARVHRRMKIKTGLIAASNLDQAMAED